MRPAGCCGAALSPWATLHDLSSHQQAGHKAQFAQGSALWVAGGKPDVVVQQLRAAARKAAADAQVVATIAWAGSLIACLRAPNSRPAGTPTPG